MREPRQRKQAQHNRAKAALQQHISSSSTAASSKTAAAAKRKSRRKSQKRETAAAARSKNGKQAGRKAAAQRRKLTENNQTGPCRKQQKRGCRTKRAQALQHARQQGPTQTSTRTDERPSCTSRCPPCPWIARRASGGGRAWGTSSVSVGCHHSARSFSRPENKSNIDGCLRVASPIFRMRCNQGSKQKTCAR